MTCLICESILYFTVKFKNTLQHSFSCAHKDHEAANVGKVNYAY